MATTVSELQTRITGDVSDLQNKLNQADKKVDSFASRTSQAMGAIAVGIGASLAAGAAAIGVGSLKASIAFESQFAEVRKTVDATDEELKTLRNTLRDMATSPENPLSSLENAHETLTGIMAMGGALGIATEDLGSFTETVGMMTVATNMGAEDAANFFARFANVTGIDASQFENVGNTIVELGNNMAASESEIAGFAMRLAPLASYDWSPADILGYSSAMASMGISAELGGTNLFKTVGALTEAMATGEDLEKWAEIAGTTADEFESLGSTDPSGAFGGFLEGLSKMDASEQILSLKALGITSVEQISTLQRLAAGYETVEQGLGLANSAFVDSNALLDEAAAKADTTAGKMNLFRNVLRNIGITIGDSIKPQFDDFLDVLITAGIGVNKLLSGEVDISGFAGQIKAGLTGVGDEIRSSINDIAGKVTGVGDAIRLAITGDFKRGMFGGAAEDSEIVMSILDFRNGVVTGVQNAFTNVTITLASFSDSINAAITGAVGGLQIGDVDISGITTGIESSFTGLQFDSAGIQATFETHFDSIIGLVGIAAGIVFGGPIGMAIGAAKLVSSAIESDFLGIGTLLNDSGIIDTVQSAFSDLQTTIGNAVSSIFGGGGGADLPGMNPAEEFANAMGDSGGSFDLSGFSSFFSGLQGIWDGHIAPLVDAVGDVISQDIIPGFTDLMTGINEVLTKVGEGDLSGIESGITAFENLVNIVIRVGGGLIGGALSGLGEGLPLLADGIGGILGALSDAGKGDWTGALEGLVTGIGSLASGVLSIPAGAADKVIGMIEGITGTELPSVDEGLGAWVDAFQNAGVAVAIIVDDIERRIRMGLLDIQIFLLDQAIAIANNPLMQFSPMAGQLNQAVEGAEMAKSFLEGARGEFERADTMGELLRGQMATGDLNVTQTMGFNLKGQAITVSDMLLDIPPDAFSAVDILAVKDALALAINSADWESAGALLPVAEMIGVDVTGLDAIIKEGLATALSGDLAGAITGGDMGATLDILEMAPDLTLDTENMDVEGARLQVTEWINMALSAEDYGAVDALAQLALELGVDPAAIQTQIDSKLVDAVAEKAFNAVATVNLTLNVGGIDTSAVAAAVAGATAAAGGGAPAGAPAGVQAFHGGGKYENPNGEGLAWLQDQEVVLTPAQQATVAAMAAGGRGGGGDSITVNSFGKNPYELVDMVDRTKRGRGRR